MNANSTKIIIVIAAIVVVAAGVGAFMVLNQNSDNSTKNIDASLEVYGNANNDYRIDNKDLSIIEKIIKKESGYTLEKYPLADAYYDGVVDDKDIQQVKDIIAGAKDGNQFSVWHINHTTDLTNYPSGSYVVDTKWPITKTVANGAANSLTLYEMVGLTDNIVGMNYSSGSPPDKIIYPKYAAFESLGSSTTNLNEEKLVACLKDNPGTTAVITADNKSYLASGCNEKYIEETLKIDVIRIQHAAVDPKEHSSAILLLGFLFQKDTKAEEVAEWTTAVFKELDKKLDGAAKVRVASSSGEKYLSARNSDYADVAVQAGGEYTLWEQSSSSIYFKEYKGSSKTYEPDPRVFLEEYQADKILGIRTGAFLGSVKDGASWYGSPDKWDVAKMKAYVEDFSVFKCYDDKAVTVISGDMPIVARVLYAASALYPDLISKEYADEKHQEFVDKFLGGSYIVKDCHFIFTQEEIEAMKG
jgi:hypothetical protein